MKRVKSQTFNGVNYKIEVEDKIVGWCDNPKPGYTWEYPAIRLPNGLPNTKQALINLLHECLHASKWSKYEKTTDRAAMEIGTLLWRLGYRRKK